MTSQTLLDQGVTMLYAVEADAEDPGALLLVVPVRVGDQQRWLNVQRGLTRVCRDNLTECYGPADSAALEQLDALLRVALDL